MHPPVHPSIHPAIDSFPNHSLRCIIHSSIHLCIHSSVYLFSQPSNYTSTIQISSHSFIYLYIHLYPSSIHPSIYQTIHITKHPPFKFIQSSINITSIYQCIHLFICLSIYPLAHYLFVLPGVSSIHPSIHPSIYPYINPSTNSFRTPSCRCICRVVVW